MDEVFGVECFTKKEGYEEALKHIEDINVGDPIYTECTDNDGNDTGDWISINRLQNGCIINNEEIDNFPTKTEAND